MRTTQAECLEALREAAERLGKSPTKAEYEELGLTPASTTIRRVVGGWNEAKERAGLETFEQDDNGGTEIRPKPDWVEIPADMEWESLTAQQRWYYKNREHRIETKDTRRQNLRRWFYEFKRDKLDCVRCGEGRPSALDFHHDGEKEHGVSKMVNDGYSRARIREAMNRCVVLCANCHRKEHDVGPDPSSLPTRPDIEAATGDVPEHEARRLRREWLTVYKRDSDGCRNCDITSPVCLDFHHTQEKSMRVAQMVSFGRPISEIRDEIRKCVLLCANCHRHRHFEPPATDD